MTWAGSSRSAESISEPIAEIEDIGLPSILEVIQEGIGVERSKRRSALTEGLKAGGRSTSPLASRAVATSTGCTREIASFSREIIYRGRPSKTPTRSRVGT
jgi:hypothetical protein